MRKNFANKLTFTSIVLFLLLTTIAFSQNNDNNTSKSSFWEKVQFGGGLGLGFGNGYTNITVAPSGIYNFNEQFAAGIGLQYSYVKDRGLYTSNIYGGSLIGLYNPIPQIQLSTELEQLRVNTTFDSFLGGGSAENWNTALFLGAGYRMRNVTLGLRYNVLHDDNDSIYADAFMPFIRVFF